MAANLRKLGRPGQTWAPGWGIASWFVPPCFVYAVPWLMFKELWRGSDPGVPPGDPSWKQRPVPATDHGLVGAVRPCAVAWDLLGCRRRESARAGMTMRTTRRALPRLRRHQHLLHGRRHGRDRGLHQVGQGPLVATHAGHPRGLMLYLVRHAKAGSRHDFHGNDRLRPLSKAGHRQAEALALAVGRGGREDARQQPVSPMHRDPSTHRQGGRRRCRDRLTPRGGPELRRSSGAAGDGARGRRCAATAMSYRRQLLRSNVGDARSPQSPSGARAACGCWNAA